MVILLKQRIHQMTDSRVCTFSGPDVWHRRLLCLHAKFQQKLLTIALVIAKFKYLTFDPLVGVKGVGYNFDTDMLIYRHWAIMVNCKVVKYNSFDEM